MSTSAVMSALGTLAWLIAAAYGVALLERLIAPADGARAGARAFVQPAASAVRLLRARRTTPPRPDGALFGSAPVVALATVALVAFTIPLSPSATAASTPVSLFAFLVLLGPIAVALANGGWGANGAYGLVGSLRAAAHLVSYEVMLGFAILGPAMAAQSLSFAAIARAQHALWYIIWQPLGFVLFLASAFFTIYRRPFDLPMAGSELAGGVLAEYSGSALLLWRLALDGLLFLVGAAGALLYLGGWSGPPVLPGAAWLILKSYAIVALLLAIGRRVPRLRVDEMLVFSWKILLPVAFVNLALVGTLILVGVS